MTTALINDLCCMQLLYAQATKPELRQITNSIYSTLISEPENRAILRDKYYIPNSRVSVVNTTAEMSIEYADKLVQISGSKAAAILVNQQLGEVAYRCVFTADRTPIFELAGGASVPSSAPTVSEEQQKALVLTLWHLAFNDSDREEFLNSQNKASVLQGIEVDGNALNAEISTWIDEQVQAQNITDLKDFIGFYLYKATW
ncbi:hypothetical protein N480_14760 [Pseudoalteromonas luteoviolacea S2607]|uniref:hypothetical protein n=1 Tax=Pseudoalteromonas luteoviolacea TaxID=43657 RepID=UPI0007B09292|nr:hypothetical protein [Pseudoalteromonas luteoviolacea]KZN38002.1 hypothetical protein N480_14760 [Pseudoalteromonas luteoviolacea S2607]